MLHIPAQVSLREVGILSDYISWHRGESYLECSGSLKDADERPRWGWSEILKIVIMNKRAKNK